MATKIGVAVMAVLLLLYIVSVGQLAVILMGSGDPVAIAMGIALAVLPVIGVWALVVELLFGYRSSALVRTLAAEGSLPMQDVAASPSGRADRAQADAEFPRYQAEAESSPESWRAWLRLSLAYDACGDRRRARQAARRAISLNRAA